MVESKSCRTFVITKTNKYNNIMKLEVNPQATKLELINEALAFSKYSGDAEAMEYLNDVMSELRWSMTENEYKNFQDRINSLLTQ